MISLHRAKNGSVCMTAASGSGSLARTRCGLPEGVPGTEEGTHESV